MVTVTETRALRRRHLFSGYRAEVVVEKLFEPLGTTFVVIVPEQSMFASVVPNIRLREELGEALWQERNDFYGMRLIDRIAVIEKKWKEQGIHVRRKILWF